MQRQSHGELVISQHDESEMVDGSGEQHSDLERGGATYQMPSNSHVMFSINRGVVEETNEL